MEPTIHSLTLCCTNTVVTSLNHSRKRLLVELTVYKAVCAKIMTKACEKREVDDEVNYSQARL